MKIASVADVKARFSSYINASSRGAVVITRNGKAVAAIVPVTDQEDLERLSIAYSPKVRSILSAAQERIDSGKGIPHQELWRQFQAPRQSRKKRTPRKKSA